MRTGFPSILTMSPSCVTVRCLPGDMQMHYAPTRGSVEPAAGLAVGCANLYRDEKERPAEAGQSAIHCEFGSALISGGSLTVYATLHTSAAAVHFETALDASSSHQLPSVSTC